MKVICNLEYKYRGWENKDIKGSVFIFSISCTIKWFFFICGYKYDQSNTLYKLIVNVSSLLYKLS